MNKLGEINKPAHSEITQWMIKTHHIIKCLFCDSRAVTLWTKRAIKKNVNIKIKTDFWLLNRNVSYVKKKKNLFN